MRKIILASGSPRRKQLLAQMGIPFEIVPSSFDEWLDDSRSVVEMAKTLGLGKAQNVAEQYPEAIVIGSDTIVSFEGKQLGKPDNREHAREMIAWLCDKDADITTSLALVCKATDTRVVEVECTKIRLKPFDAKAVEAYLDTGDYADKAGGFGVQSGFGHLVDYIEGDYDAIIGLPTHRLARMLQKLGVEAHPAKIDSPLPQRSAVK
jgi:septum formation protein